MFTGRLQFVDGEWQHYDRETMQRKQAVKSRYKYGANSNLYQSPSPNLETMMEKALAVGENKQILSKGQMALQAD
jgi:hypothetical protein